MPTTLGGLIKDLRIQKNLSQLEIALSLGWKEASRLSRIEQGHAAKPNRTLLDQLMDAMKLTTEERNRIYIAGNYLPTGKDIAIARTKLTPLIDSWPYPASSLDYSWRVIYTNQKLYGIYNIPTKQQRLIEANLPNMLEIIFSPGFAGDNPDEDFYIRLLAQFQYNQRSRTKEHWYLDLVQSMMQNDFFRKLWPLAQQYQTKDYDVFNFAQKTISPFNFYSVLLPVFNDARFIVEYYFPADPKTHQQYQSPH